MTDLVVLSLEAWDRVWRRNQHLIAGLIGQEPEMRVLFVEPAVDPLHDARSGRRPRMGRGLRTVQVATPQGIRRVTAFEPTKFLPRRVDPNFDRRWAQAVVAQVSRSGLDRPFLWINDPAGCEVLRLTGWPSLYDITDDWLAADRPPAVLTRQRAQEEYLIQTCDRLVVCSTHLAASKGRGRTPVLIHNAVDTKEYLRPRPRPADMPAGSVALYVGTAHPDRLDVALTLQTAAQLGGAGTVVIVGPVLLPAADRESLTAAGVVLLGARDAADVPAYLQHADVLLVPHVVSPFTESLDPIKLYEYQTIGRPVVSTRVGGFRDAGGRVLVADADEFPATVSALIPAEDHFPAGADSSVADWTERVAQMREVIEELESTSR